MNRKFSEVLKNYAIISGQLVKDSNAPIGVEKLFQFIRSPEFDVDRMRDLQQSLNSNSGTTLPSSRNNKQPEIPKESTFKPDQQSINNSKIA